MIKQNKIPLSDVSISMVHSIGIYKEKRDSLFVGFFLMRYEGEWVKVFAHSKFKTIIGASIIMVNDIQRALIERNKDYIIVCFNKKKNAFGFVKKSSIM